MFTLFNRPHRKLASEDELQGETEHRTRVHISVHEDSSTVSTKKEEKKIMEEAIKKGKKHSLNGDDEALIDRLLEKEEKNCKCISKNSNKI